MDTGAAIISLTIETQKGHPFFSNPDVEPLYLSFKFTLKVYLKIE